MPWPLPAPGPRLHGHRLCAVCNAAPPPTHTLAHPAFLGLPPAAVGASPTIPPVVHPAFALHDSCCPPAVANRLGSNIPARPIDTSPQLCLHLCAEYSLPPHTPTVNRFMHSPRLQGPFLKITDNGADQLMYSFALLFGGLGQMLAGWVGPAAWPLQRGSPPCSVLCSVTASARLPACASLRPLLHAARHTGLHRLVTGA